MRLLGLALVALLLCASPGAAQYHPALGAPGPQGPTGATGPQGVPGDVTTHLVLGGPRLCAAGSNSGNECYTDTNCPSSTCTGTAQLTWSDVDSIKAGACAPGTCNATTIALGECVEWFYRTSVHDLAGGSTCVGGSNAGGPCDASDTHCHVCTGGSNDGHHCTINGNCTGGGTCDLTGTCTGTLAETWDGGSHAAPYTYTHCFTTAGTYPYICSTHAGSDMQGTVVVRP